MTTTTSIKAGARLTLDEFFELPEMEQRIELHEGALYIMPEPNLDHQFLTQLLWKYLFDQLVAAGLAYAYVPVNLALSATVCVAPDIIVVRAGREGTIHRVRVYGAPDIVVEVLSSDRNRDLVDKRRWYAAAGVAEYWILDTGPGRRHPHPAGAGRRWALPGAGRPHRRRHPDHAPVPGVQPAAGATV